MNKSDPSYEEILKKDGRVPFRNVGFSMRPLLYQGRDEAIIERQLNGQYRRGDIVLYKIYDKYFINRIARVFPGGYYFCEDNSGKTYLFFSPACQIIGIMTSFLRNGKAYSVNDWRYRLYSFVWSFLVIPIRSSASGTIKRISWIIHRGRVIRGCCVSRTKYLAVENQ